MISPVCAKTDYDPRRQVHLVGIAVEEDDLLLNVHPSKQRRRRGSEIPRVLARAGQLEETDQAGPVEVGFSANIRSTGLVDLELASDGRDRSAGGLNQLHGLAYRRRGEVPT